jgi:hypothetical protein
MPRLPDAGGMGRLETQGGPAAIGGQDPAFLIFYSVGKVVS